MKTTQEMIAVMQAFVDGKEIQQGNDRYGWFTLHTPSWDWSACDYRVKQEPPKSKIVPYESAEEFLAAMKEHGPMIKGQSGYYSILRIYFTGISYCLGNCPYGSLMDQFVWQDGTPCGKEVIE